MKFPDPRPEPNAGDVESDVPVDLPGGDPCVPRFNSRLRLLVLLAIAALLWWLPAPAGLEPRGWHLLGLFLSTILGFVLQPLPMGPLVLLALSLICLTRLASLDQALAGYADHTVWLVVAAFLLAGVVRQTGLGRRIALNLICRLGHTLTGLGHAICASELILGPVVPSNTARGGGILAPLVQALAQSLDDGKNQAGRYLALVGAHANLVSAAMFLTGMAANPLVAKAASEIYHLDFSWSRWALGALVPGLTSLLLLPFWLGWLIKLP
ncbi:MAG: SLC13 family permease, partial [Candidatus Sericytochromatia bacterium]